MTFHSVGLWCLFKSRANLLLTGKMGEDRYNGVDSGVNSDLTAPLLFFYVQLHKAIRRELSGLSESVVSLETGYAKQGKPKAEELLLHLKKRYRFLEQVYKYHSSIEDEVGSFGT